MRKLLALVKTGRCGSREPPLRLITFEVPVPALNSEAIWVKGDRPLRRRRLFVGKPLSLILGPSHGFSASGVAMPPCYPNSDVEGKYRATGSLDGT